MKYAWIERNKLRWPVCVQCRVLSVSASGYRQHLARRKKILTRRHLSETALLVEIRAVYAEAHGAYGWPRVWRQLKRQGVRIGKRRVELAMWRNGIRARGKRRFRVATTDSNHALPIAPNLLGGCYTDLLAGHGIKASMSRKGNCWDNACSETLFGSLKVERLHGMEFKSHREAKDVTLAWLLLYDGSRMHSTLDYLSPAQFEQQAIASPLALAA